MRIEKEEVNSNQEIIETFVEYKNYCGLNTQEAIDATHTILGVSLVEVMESLKAQGLLEADDKKDDKEDDDKKDDKKKDDEKEVKETEDKKDDKEDKKDNEKEDDKEDEKKEESLQIITIDEDIQLPGTDVILEKGDKIKVIQ